MHSGSVLIFGRQDVLPHFMFQLCAIQSEEYFHGGGVVLVKLIRKYFTRGGGYWFSCEFCEDLWMVPNLFPFISCYFCLSLCRGHLFVVCIVSEAMCQYGGFDGCGVVVVIDFHSCG